MAPRINVRTTWRWVVSFLPRPHYPRYQLERRLGGTPESVWSRWRREKSLTLIWNGTPVIQPVA